MASLTGTKIKDTYDALLKVSDNGALDGTLQTITDGLGNNSSLSLSTAGASVTGTLAVSGNAAFDTNTLFVDAANNYIGIGISNPATQLNISKDSADVEVRISTTTSGNPRLGMDASGAVYNWIQTDRSSSAMQFAIANAERMRIDSSGNVGIGTASPRLRLEVTGTDAAESGTATPNGAIMVGNPIASNSQTLTMGTVNGAGNHSWIQSRNSTQAVFYNLALNPNEGNVGIGTVSLNDSFTIHNSSSVTTTGITTRNGITLRNTNSTNGNFTSIENEDASGNQNARITFINNNHAASGSISFTTRDGASFGEKMRIDSSGNVGIGTTPSAWSTLTVLQVKNAYFGGAGNNSYFGANLYYDGTFYRYINDGYANFYTQQSGFHSFYNAPSGSAGGIASVTEVMRIDASGVVSIGPSGNQIKLQSTGTFVSSTLNAHIINSDGTGAYGSGNLLIQPRCSSGAGSTGIIFATSNNTDTPVERMRILSSGGITFNGDTAAANALDDYEEGTFTPVLSFAGGTTGITYSEQTGKYTKIGRQVTVQVSLGLTSKGSSSGRVEITMPFTSTADQYTGAIELRNVTYTSKKYAIVEVGRAAGTFARVIFMDSAANSAECTNSDVANDSVFLFSFTYFV